MQSRNIQHKSKSKAKSNATQNSKDARKCEAKTQDVRYKCKILSYRMGKISMYPYYVCKAKIHEGNLNAIL